MRLGCGLVDPVGRRHAQGFVEPLHRTTHIALHVERRREFVTEGSSERRASGVMSTPFLKILGGLEVTLLQCAHTSQLA